MTLKLKSLLLSTALAASFAVSADDLLQIYQLAETRDPQILQSKAERDQAFENITEQRAALLPQIGFSAGASYTATDNQAIDSISNTQASLGLQQALYSPSSWKNLSISEMSAAQADARYQAAQQQLMMRVSEAYFAVLSALDQLNFTAANKLAVARQLEQTKQRFQVGLTAITDVHEAQAEYDRTLAEEIQAMNSLSNSYEGLREITGLEHRQLSLLNADYFSAQPPKGYSQAWLEQANQHNLQLQANRIAKQIAEQQIKLAQSGHQPTLNLAASLGYDNNSYGNDNYDRSNGGSANSGTIGLDFSLPLYSGGAISSQVKQAQLAYISASEALEQRFRSVQSQTNSLLNNVNASVSSIKAYQQTVVSSQSALAATEAGFEVGTRTIVDVQDATRNLYSAKSQLANARYNYILNVLYLKQTAGSLNPEDLKQINAGLMQPSD